MSEKQNTEEQIHEQAKVLKEKGIHELNNNNLKDVKLNKTKQILNYKNKKGFEIFH